MHVSVRLADRAGPTLTVDLPGSTLRTMRYPYYDLRDGDFEDLVVLLCAHLLGPGVQPFSTGPDGGRDARFAGTADRFPSASSNLSGQFVIQAKHTEHPFARLSDPDFSGDSDSSTLSKEIVRVRNLVGRGEVEHYILFTNRRVAGQADEMVRKRVLEETSVQTAYVIGVEGLDLQLKLAPQIEAAARLTELRAPFRVSSDHLAEIISALVAQKDSFVEVRGPEPRVPFERKNEINNLSADFAKLIRRNYLSHFPRVSAFLADPRNDRYVEHYEEAVAEFNEQIVAYADELDSMDKVLVNLHRILTQRDPILARHVRGTKLVLYYMYWHCDLGEDGD